MPAASPEPEPAPEPTPTPDPVPAPAPLSSPPAPTTSTPLPAPLPELAPAAFTPVPTQTPDPAPERTPGPSPSPASPPTRTHAHTPAPIPLADLLSYGEPSDLYRQLRREYGDVVPVVLDGGIPAWLVLGYRELHQVTSDPVLFSRDPELWSQWPNIPDDWPLLPVISRRQPSILATVGERHRSRATMIGEALEAVDPFELRGHVERFADELIDVVCGTGQADLIGQYAALLPVRVLAMLLGFPEEHGPGIVTTLNDILDGGDRARPAEAFLTTSMTRLVGERRERPYDDVVSRLLSNTAGFTVEEVTHDLMVILAAGHQPTTDWIGNSLRLMLTDDRFAASLFGGRSSVAEAMNEVLWEDAPIQNAAGRWTTRDTRLGGRALRAGDLVLLGLQGANSDPRVRTDRTALTGGNNAHFSFGHGEHRCPFPAQEIAEVIARTGIEVVLDRLPDLDLAVPPDTLARRSSPWLRGLVRLPVRFSPTPPLGRR
ncbi:cytochrome P450 [Streptomyces sp. NPDC002643]